MAEKFIPTPHEFDEGTEGLKTRRQPHEAIAPVQAEHGALRRAWTKARERLRRPIEQLPLEVPVRVGSRPQREVTLDRVSSNESSAALASKSGGDDVSNTAGLVVASESASTEAALNLEPPQAISEFNEVPPTADAVQIKAPRSEPVLQAPRARKPPAPKFEHWDADDFAAVVTVMRDPQAGVQKIDPNRLAKLEHGIDDDSLALFQWWQGSGAAPILDFSGIELTGFPEESAHAVRHVFDLGGAQLRKYRAQVAAKESLTAALTGLSRAAEEYPSLEPMLDHLRRGELELADLSKPDYTSAAWHECREQITSALETAKSIRRRLDPTTPVCALPRPGQVENLSRAVISTFSFEANVAGYRKANVDLLKERRSQLSVGVPGELRDWLAGLK